MRIPSKAHRLLTLSQLCLYLGLAVSVLLLPEGLTVDHGMSYFGNSGRTLVPHVFGLVSSGALAWYAARFLTEPALKPLRRSLQMFSLLTLGLAVTPSMYDERFSLVHKTFGSLLFTLQFGTAIWIMAITKRDPVKMVLFIVLLVAGTLCALYLKPVSGYLLQSQVVFQLAFGLLILRSFPPND